MTNSLYKRSEVNKIFLTSVYSILSKQKFASMETITNSLDIAEIAVHLQELITAAYPDSQLIYDPALHRMAKFCAENSSKNHNVPHSLIVQQFGYAKNVFSHTMTVKPTKTENAAELFFQRLQRRTEIMQALKESKINSIGISSVANPNHTVTISFITYYFDIPANVYDSIPQEPSAFEPDAIFEVINKIHKIVIQRDLTQNKELLSVIHKEKTLLQAEPEKISEVEKDLNQYMQSKGSYVIIHSPEMDTLPKFMTECIGNVDFMNVVFTDISELASDLVVDKNGKKYLFILANYSPFPTLPQKKPAATQKPKRPKKEPQTILTPEQFEEKLLETLNEEREKSEKAKFILGEPAIVDVTKQLASFGSTNKTTAVPKKFKTTLQSYVGDNNYFIHLNFITSNFTEEAAKNYIDDLVRTYQITQFLDEQFTDVAVSVTQSFRQICIAFVLYKKTA